MVSLSTSLYAQELPPCMLGLAYEDPNLYVSATEIINAIKDHPPADTQYKFFVQFERARKSGASEQLLNELASNITAFYKRREKVAGFDPQAESYGLQISAILQDLEERAYISKRK